MNIYFKILCAFIILCSFSCTVTDENEKEIRRLLQRQINSKDTLNWVEYERAVRNIGKESIPYIYDELKNTSDTFTLIKSGIVVASLFEDYPVDLIINFGEEYSQDNIDVINCVVIFEILKRKVKEMMDKALDGNSLEKLKYPVFPKELVHVLIKILSYDSYYSKLYRGENVPISDIAHGILDDIININDVPDNLLSSYKRRWEPQEVTYLLQWWDKHKEDFEFQRNQYILNSN